MPKIATASLFAAAVLALAPAAALADPDGDGNGPDGAGKGGSGGAYPCPNGQFWYPQYDQCVVMCKPGFDHINSPDLCDPIPVMNGLRSGREEKGSHARTA